MCFCALPYLLSLFYGLIHMINAFYLSHADRFRNLNVSYVNCSLFIGVILYMYVSIRLGLFVCRCTIARALYFFCFVLVVLSRTIVCFSPRITVMGCRAVDSYCLVVIFFIFDLPFFLALISFELILRVFKYAGVFFFYLFIYSLIFILTL